MRKVQIVKKGEKFGHLKVISDPYYPDFSKGHRRQHVDCKCDCGQTRENINSSYLKRGTVIHYCSYSCPFYHKECPRTTEVLEKSKKLSLGFRSNKLTVTKTAFYHQGKGEANRHKCVECTCDCGNIKIYREDKVARHCYKSCGCSWERNTLQGKSKKCPSCKTLRDLSMFRSNNQCATCVRDRHILKTYGITKQQYKDMLKRQKGCCAICESKTSKTNQTEFFHVDHCHTTGKVRGLLCSKCNSGLGSFEDNPKFLQRAISYLS